MNENADVTESHWNDPPVSWVAVPPGGPVPPPIAGWLYPVLHYLRQAVAHEDGSGDLRLDDAFGNVPRPVLDTVDALFGTEAPAATVSVTSGQEAGLRLIEQLRRQADAESDRPGTGVLLGHMELQRLLPPTRQQRGGLVDLATADGRRIFELFLLMKTQVEQGDGNWPGGDVVDALTKWFAEVGLDPDAPVLDLLRGDDSTSRPPASLEGHRP